jgi:hypothetical protein
MSWNGTAWSSAAAPPSSQIGLEGASCTSDAACLAVGTQVGTDVSTSPPQAIVEQWNGSAWTSISGGIGSPSELNAVACSRASWCVAVGQQPAFGGPTLLVERWDGATLVRMRVPG